MLKTFKGEIFAMEYHQIEDDGVCDRQALVNMLNERMKTEPYAQDRHLFIQFLCGVIGKDSSDLYDEYETWARKTFGKTPWECNFTEVK